MKSASRAFLMLMARRRRHISGVLALLLLFGASLAAAETGQSVGPAESGDPWANEPIPTVTADGIELRSFRLTGSTLRPRENDVSYAFGSGGGCTYVTAGSASTVWNHSVTLPQGSVVNTLRMYYDDTSASNSTGWFTVYDLYGSLVQEWSVSSSGNFGRSFNDSATIDHQIDYNAYSYVLNWRPNATGSTLQLCGFRIFYQPPELIFADGFESGNTSAWN